MKKLLLTFKISVFVLLIFSAKISAQCTAATVPYYEGFQSISANNQLPSCWASNSTSVNCLTYFLSNSFAAFYYNPAGTSHFFSKGIQLYTGITYSTSLFYKTSNTINTNWTNLSIKIGNSQSATGLSNIASISGGSMSALYTPLSNTFVVGSSGVYYLAIEATSTISTGSTYLIWDDLSLTVACGLAGYSPTLSIVSSATSICTGENMSQVTFTAGGANTYSWNTGAITDTARASSIIGNQYIVYGTNTLTGCTSTLSKVISILTSPNVVTYASGPSICLGKSLVIAAVGAFSYTWSTGQISQSITVSPTVTTSYTVVGISTNGCNGSGVEIVKVNPLPNLSYISDKDTICDGEEVQLFGFGAKTYTWISPGGNVNLQNTFTVSPTTNSTYTLQGADSLGCINNLKADIVVNLCTSKLENNRNKFNLEVYPNPSNGNLLIQSNEEIKSISITEISGKQIVFTEVKTNNYSKLINISDSPSGIYFIHAVTSIGIQNLKIVKE
jgi:hypothetical protein